MQDFPTTSMPEIGTAEKRPRIRFSLRTLMLLVAAIAVTLWTFQIGLPAINTYFERHRVEEAVKKIKVGMTLSDALRQLPEVHGTAIHTDEKGNWIGITTIDVKSAIYFVICQFSTKPNKEYNSLDRVNSVQVFRVPPVPQSYPMHSYPANSQYWAYHDDAENILMHGRKGDDGIKLDLIYSDPSAAP